MPRRKFSSSSSSSSDARSSFGGTFRNFGRQIRRAFDSPTRYNAGRSRNSGRGRRGWERVRYDGWTRPTRKNHRRDRYSEADGYGQDNYEEEWYEPAPARDRYEEQSCEAAAARDARQGAQNVEQWLSDQSDRDLNAERNRYRSNSRPQGTCRDEQYDQYDRERDRDHPAANRTRDPSVSSGSIEEITRVNPPWEQQENPRNEWTYTETWLPPRCRNRRGRFRPAYTCAPPPQLDDFDYGYYRRDPRRTRW